MTRWIPLVVALAVLVPAAGARASAWVPDPGDAYLKLWTKWLLGIGHHDRVGHVEPFGRYHEIFLSTYGEVGVFEGGAVFWHTDLLRAFSLEDPRPGEGGDGSHLGVGDPALGLRFRILQVGRCSMTTDLSVRAPLADADPVQDVYGTDAGNPLLGRLRIGAGVWDVTARISGGYGWDRWYLAASAGFTSRSDDYDGVVLWTAEVGGRFTDRIGGRLRLTGHHAIRQGLAPYDDSPSGIGNGTTYTGAAVEVEYMFVPDWWVGGTIEGSARLVEVEGQSGGPVTTIFAATRL